MYQTSARFRELMAQPSRTLTAKGIITYPDYTTQEITAEHISSVNVVEDAGQHLPIGGVGASTISISLDNRAGEWNYGGKLLGAKSLDGAVLSVKIGVLDPEYSPPENTAEGGYPDSVYTASYDGGEPSTVYTETLDGGGPDDYKPEYFWSGIGVFTIENTAGQEQQTLIALKGADALANKGMVPFIDALAYPTTIGSILESACSQAGIPLKSSVFTNSTVVIGAAPVWGEATCRDIIGYVACCAAGFARIGRNGMLEIVPIRQRSEIEEDDYYCYPSRYITLDRQGSIFGPFNSLTVHEYGAPNGYGATRIAVDLDIEDNELNSVGIQGNPLLGYNTAWKDTIIASMLSELSGISFVGGALTWQGDPTLTAGDNLTIFDLKDNKLVMLVLNQTLTFGNGFGMVSGNKLNSKVQGAAKTAYMRVFTPTGKLNATALEGDINIKAGENLNLMAGSDVNVNAGADFNVNAGANVNVKAGADLNIEGGGKINIASGGDINIASGADMTISAGGNFNLSAGTGKSGIGMSNDRPDDAFIWAGSDTPANAPFRVTMDGELTASSIGGGLVIPVANGGTGYNRQTIHRGTDYPSSGFGQDGDLFIFHNGQADSSWSAQTLAYGTGGQNTYFGVNRNWNQVPTAGFYRFGNGVGSSAYDFGAYAYFTAPAAVKSLTFTFVTAKYYNSTWYGYSGTTTYKVALVKASNMSVILASATCYASQSQNTQTVTLTTAANMVQGDTYYIAVYFDGSDEKTNAGIVGSVEMQGKVSNSRTFDLLLKSGGEWRALFGNG